MGKIGKTFALLFVLLLIASLMMFPSSFVKAQSKTIVVPDDYDTIQSAIDHANNGDTVFVKSGYYPETLVVNKSISIIGEDRNQTIIDGQKKLCQVVLIEAMNVTFSNFTLGNSGFEPPHNSGWYQSDGQGDGIRIYNGYPYEQQFVNVINNTIIDCPYFGINIVGGSRNNTIVGNIIFDRYSGNPPLPYAIWGLGSGIAVDCLYSLIAYNTLVNTTVGISLYIEGDRGNTIIENKEITASKVNSPFPSISPTASPTPSPSVPEFTVTVTEKSFNITIKNQELPDAYYKLRVKYPSDSSWWESFLGYQNDNLEYTTFSFELDEKGIARALDGTNIAQFPYSGKVDFQVMISNYREVGREASPPNNWIYAGSDSPWSSTQTYTFPNLTNPTPTPPQPTPDIGNIIGLGLDWIQLVTWTLLSVIIVLLFIVIFYLRKKKS